MIDDIRRLEDAVARGDILDCAACDGSGKVGADERCGECEGSGLVSRFHVYEPTIEEYDRQRDEDACAEAAAERRMQRYDLD